MSKKEDRDMIDLLAAELEQEDPSSPQAERLRAMISALKKNPDASYDDCVAENPEAFADRSDVADALTAFLNAKMDAKPRSAAEYIDSAEVITIGEKETLVMRVSTEKGAICAISIFLNSLAKYDWFAIVRDGQVRIWGKNKAGDDIELDTQIPEAEFEERLFGNPDGEPREPIGQKWASIPFSDEDRKRLGPDWPVQLVHGASGKRVEVRCGGSINAVDRSHPALEMVRELDQTQAVLVCDDGRKWFSIDGAGNWVHALYAPA